MRIPRKPVDPAAETAAPRALRPADTARALRLTFAALPLADGAFRARFAITLTLMMTAAALNAAVPN
ncbi:MAG: hypothetical protein VW405_18055, partial [Rhodospirillaceae bacterium]